MKKIIITTIDDSPLAMATPSDACVNPDVEDHWHCVDCGFGVGIPPGKITKEKMFYVVTDGRCPKCRSNKFSRSMLSNKR